MQINPISNTNFDGRTPKQRFITPFMRSSIESILLKMNSETKRVQDGDHFKTTINTKIHYNNDKAIFTDERRLKKRVEFEKQMQGFSSLSIGSKAVIDIDNKSGEIIDIVKPKFKPFFMVIRQAEKILANIRTNFNLPQVVQKEFLTLNELTPEGAKKIKKIVLQFEKERLENIVKKLEEDSK